MAIPEGMKVFAGRVVTSVAPQCSFDRCVFILGHMRCGSTITSNLLCSRPEISGYGETHVSYSDVSATGRLALNLAKRGVWQPGADFLFDKVLHTRLDRDPPAAFFQARAFFMTRQPDRAVPSIYNLFRKIGSSQYQTLGAAARYYTKRLEHLAVLWQRFPESGRMALDYDGLIADPDGEIGKISRFLGLMPPLENAYEANALTLTPGAGDPLASHQHQSIVKGGVAAETGHDSDVPDDARPAMEEARASYDAFRNLSGQLGAVD